MRNLRLLIAALVRAAGSVLARPFEDGMAALERQDHATALRLLRPLAERGHDDAQCSLGITYDTGQGVPQDDQQAMLWYRKAADQGHVSAQYNLVH